MCNYFSFGIDAMTGYGNILPLKYVEQFQDLISQELLQGSAIKQFTVGKALRECFQTATQLIVFCIKSKNIKSLVLATKLNQYPLKVKRANNFRALFRRLIMIIV